MYLIGAIKLLPDQKRITDRKEKIKGSWSGTCIQYTRLHYYYYIRIHTSDAHTISHILIFKKTKRYNACTICHHLVGDKTCRGNKTCRNVPHYSQYIQNFLTGRVRFCTWFLKVSLVSKIRQKNLDSFTILIGVFPKGCSGPGEIHTAGESVFEAENLKPFSDTQSLMLLTQLNQWLFYQWLSPHAQSKVVHKQGAIYTFKTALTMLILFRAEWGWGQDATLRDPHLLLVQPWQSAAHSNPKITFGQEALNIPGEMALEIKIPEVRQNTVLPRCRRKWLGHAHFWQRHL